MLITTLTMLTLPLSVFLYKGYKNTYSATTNHIKVNSSTEHPNSIKILQLSDLHLENISISADQLYEEVKNETIDLIAITGDFLDKKKSIPKLSPYLEKLQYLNAQYGIYAVFGNHDYVLKDQDLIELKNVLKQFDVTILENENQTVIMNGKRLNIIGIDDYGTSHSDIKKAYDGVKDGFNLVLTHDPNVVLEMKDYHFDYLLSGHFHGGQIHWPKPYHLKTMGELVRMDMTKGLHEIDGKPFYISEGLGQTGVNIRIGSRPEITFHEVGVCVNEKSKNKDKVVAG